MDDDPPKEPSLCLDDFAAALPGSGLAARFLPKPEAKAVYEAASSKFRGPGSYRWTGFEDKALPLAEVFRLVRSWPGDFAYVMFLDRADGRVVRLPKGELEVFVEEFVYPSSDTYLVSTDLRRAACLTHEDVNVAVTLPG